MIIKFATEKKGCPWERFSQRSPAGAAIHMLALPLTHTHTEALI